MVLKNILKRSIVVGATMALAILHIPHKMRSTQAYML